jgi:3-mercaptopyruvate sulfurtransferase SseA
VARQLSSLGFARVLVLKGGWKEWFDNRYPTEDKS